MARQHLVADISWLGRPSRLHRMRSIRAFHMSLRTPGPRNHKLLVPRRAPFAASPTLFAARFNNTMGENPPEESPFPLTEVDKWILSQTDEEFKKHDWEDLKGIIEANNLSVLKRKPSDLRRYMKWTSETKAKYGSMTNYLLANRLPKAWGQPPFTPVSNVPFKDPSDYHVLINDWPYGLDPEIRHIVVWLRTTIPTDPETGDMTPESRALVKAFVKEYFADTLGPDGENRVLWFKNWVALQSVRALEHIHVLVRNVDDDTIERWTGERPRQST